MPIFDYRCKACDKTFEMLVLSGETPACTACGSTDLEKLVSLPAGQKWQDHCQRPRTSRQRRAFQ